LRLAQAANGQTKEAIATAEKSMKMAAKEEKNEAYVNMNREKIEAVDERGKVIRGSLSFANPRCRMVTGVSAFSGHEQRVPVLPGGSPIHKIGTERVHEIPDARGPRFAPRAPGSSLHTKCSSRKAGAAWQRGPAYPGPPRPIS
jgi:hypothetical protein